MPATTCQVHIRWMLFRDLAEVLDIEQLSSDFPWTEDEFLCRLRCRRQQYCIGMVAEKNDRVVGFMIYELQKRKLHVLNFAVHPDYLRAGVGSQMVAKLIGKLVRIRRKRITIELRESNLPAQIFFRSQRFRAISVKQNYYEDSGEDAYMMEYSIPCVIS